MSKTIYLLRHAETEKAHTGQPDKMRSLTEKGQKDAEMLGNWMQEQMHIPAHIICSPAERTRQTLEMVHRTIGRGATVEYIQAVYNADIATLCNILAELDDTIPNTMVVAHNPGIHQLAHALADEADDPVAKEMLSHSFIPCSLAIITFAIDSWSDIGEASGKLLEYYTPDHLPLAA